jgi:hypothetical protein
MTITTAPTTARSTPALTRTMAFLATLLLLGDAVVSLLHPNAMSDHAAGPGRLSELLSGLAFITMAASLLPLSPVAGLSRALFALAPLGLGLCGILMVGVVLMHDEPPVAVFLVSVLVALVGCVVAGVVGIRSGTWPVVTGVGIALLLPALFLAPFNSVVLAEVWLLVALTTRTSKSDDDRHRRR